MVQDRPDLTNIDVLIVDDNDDLEVFSAALELYGATVLKARTARDALSMIMTVRVNAMIADLALPGDGLWLVQQVRRLPREQGGSIPAIAVTAFRDHYNAERATDAGFDARLTKPVDPLDLSKTVARLVGR